MDFKEIDYAVMEATMNVVASRARYRSKQRLIEDINKRIEEISEMATKDEEFMRARNNKACVDLMAAVYAFSLK